MKIHASGEDYLEAILILKKKSGMVRSVDLARHMGFSKDGGFVTVDREGYLHLTETGKEIAVKIYERHCVLASGLINLGVDPEQAEQDAGRMEHVVSDESFQKLREIFGQME